VSGAAKRPRASTGVRAPETPTPARSPESGVSPQGVSPQAVRHPGVLHEGVSPAVLRQVRLLEVRTRRLVNSLFTGEYRSVFKGQGLEFAEVREYLPGDEVRAIDWNVTARMARPFVKRYIEERELTIMLAVDLSGSERFGTAARFKAEAASELATVLAMSAVRNNDRVGAVLFTDRIELVVPPRKGRRHALRVIRELLAPSPVRSGTDLTGALAYLTRLLTHRTIVFVMSDFQASGYDRQLSLLGQRHDVIAVSVEDPGERSLPDVGLVRFADPETGAIIDVDTSAPGVRSAYARRTAEERLARQKLFRQLAIDEIVIGTERGVVEPLLTFFRGRETRARRRSA
jgi:uncharacterized protein (DUF58 family)